MARAGKTMTLDELSRQLQEVHGADLVAIVLYGSAASGEELGSLSDINVLVLAANLSAGRMRKLGQTMRAWQEAGNPPVVSITADEWLRSADVFPMEYADILERHRVLHGNLPLSEVAVKRADLRMQLEREAMSTLLRLRRAAMLAGTNANSQRELMTRSFSTLLVLFRAVLRLQGLVPPRDAAQVIDAVAGSCNIDPAVLHKVLLLRRDGSKAGGSELSAILDEYLNTTDSLVRHLDAFDTGNLPPHITIGDSR